jgi:hypothetical protein
LTTTQRRQVEGYTWMALLAQPHSLVSLHALSAILRAIRTSRPSNLAWAVQCTSESVLLRPWGPAAGWKATERQWGDPASQAGSVWKAAARQLPRRQSRRLRCVEHHATRVLNPHRSSSAGRTVGNNTSRPVIGRRAWVLSLALTGRAPIHES